MIPPSRVRVPAPTIGHSLAAAGGAAEAGPRARGPRARRRSSTSAS